MESFHYLRLGEHERELLGLRDVALRARPTSIPLAEAYLEYYISRKQRTPLQDYFWSLLDANQCSIPRAPRPEQLDHLAICAFLKRIWKERLSSLLFFDASAAFLERARRALELEDCREAQAALKEVEAREGSFYFLLEQKLKVALCFKDVATQARIEEELENLRL